MKREGRFEGLTRDQAIELFGSMKKGEREYGLDFQNSSNPQWHRPYLWHGETVEECLADEANFEAQTTLRGTKLIPIKFMLARYVCGQPLDGGPDAETCGANLYAFECAIEGGSVWGVLCQRDNSHSMQQRHLISDYKRRDRASRRRMAERTAEDAGEAAKVFDEIYRGEAPK